MLLKLSSQCEILQTGKEQLLFLINNKKYAFNYLFADIIFKKIIQPLRIPTALIDLAKDTFVKSNFLECSKIVESFIEIGVILIVENLNDGQKFLFLSNLYDPKNLIFLLEAQSEKNFNTYMHSVIDSSSLDHTGKNDCCILITYISERFTLNKINTFFKKIKKEWLWIEIANTAIQIGPLFNEKNSSCLECYKSRELARSSNGALLKILNQESNKVILNSVSPFFSNQLLDSFLHEQIRTIKSKGTFLAYKDKIKTIDLLTLKSAEFQIMQSSVCPVCFPDE